MMQLPVIARQRFGELVPHYATTRRRRRCWCSPALVLHGRDDLPGCGRQRQRHRDEAVRRRVRRRAARRPGSLAVGLWIVGGWLFEIARRRLAQRLGRDPGRDRGGGARMERGMTRDAALELNAPCASRFGNTEIIRGVDLADPARRAPRHHRPERRRQVHAVQPDQRALRRQPRRRSGSTASDITGLKPFEINRKGLSRSFQITNIFHRLSVFENLRCAVLWSLGYSIRSGTAWPASTDARRARRRGAARRSASTARRDAPAGVLTYAEQRALEIGITIAGGADVILLDEPTAGMSRSRNRARRRADPQRDRGQDAGHGRARHGRGVRPRRPHQRAGLRRGASPPARRRRSAPTRRCRKPTSARACRQQDADGPHA